jgi:hypothetical protein
MLVVPIASKVQPESRAQDCCWTVRWEILGEFGHRKHKRLNGSKVEASLGADEFGNTYSEIVKDLSPTTTVIFSVSCGKRKDKDKVTTYFSSCERRKRSGESVEASPRAEDPQ